eukprot:TRINITY_DN101799_c0_g1_i1.p1 TRINITY_DN101799_c0_g1~~TRINITY_DN101799_c0_g1_i1.p1  ORF type:complete len:812 (-),score=181.08 TRINITY_DN101799_c0_g1_i1:330-2765(-)
MAHAVLHHHSHKDDGDDCNRHSKKHTVRHKTFIDDWKIADVCPELRPKLRKAESHMVVLHFNEKEFDEITQEDLEDLIHILADEHQSSCEIRRLRLLLQRICEPACDDEEVIAFIAAMTGVHVKNIESQDSVMVTAEDVYKAMHGELFMRMRKDHEGGHPIARDLLADEVRRMVMRDECFRSLPFTTVFLGLYLFRIAFHLKVRGRSLMEQSLEDWTDGSTPFNAASNNVDDCTAFWDWLDDYGLAAVFGDKQKDASGKYDRLHFASKHTLVGDGFIGVKKLDGSEQEHWLLGSKQARDYLQGHPGEYRDAAAKTAEYCVEELKLADRKKIAELSLQYLSYDDYTATFSLTSMTAAFKAHISWIMINTDTMPFRSYENYPALLGVDAVFLLMTLHVFLTELKQMCSALRYGLGEFWDYWEFWNCVDWLCITGSFIEIAWKVFIILFQRDPTFTELLTDGILSADVMTMAVSSDKIPLVHEKLVGLSWWFYYWHSIMCVNVLLIVARFFKCFESNERLKVVTRTCKRASSDFAHFCVIFFAVYTPFVLLAHILFGSDVSQFSSLSVALSNVWGTLLGDFDWYIPLVERNVLGFLPSGIPTILVCFWYFTFMFLVFLVMLNMLLAIIMEHYIAVAQDVMHMLDAPSLLGQYKKLRSDTKLQKNWRWPLDHMKEMLDNDNDPAHPEETVSHASLLKAFPKMQGDQAKWLMDWLHTVEEAAPHEDHTQSDNTVMKRVAEEDATQIETLTKSVKRGSNEAEVYEKAYADILTQLKSLVDGVRQMEREQFRLCRRIDEVAANFPEDPNKKKGNRMLR